MTPERKRLKLERAMRFKAIRDDLGITQPEFAERLTQAASALGIEDVRYDVGDISTRENGRKDLEVEDYLLAGLLDRQKRPWVWLAFGRDVLERKRPVIRDEAQDARAERIEPRRSGISPRKAAGGQRGRPGHG